MIVDLGSRDWRDKKIREWLLHLLRFAVTREPADRTAVDALAKELDLLGHWSRPAAPSFFRRTSHDVCAAIQAPDTPQQTAILGMHFERIADPRLRRAFAAAVGLQQPQQPALKRSGRKAPDLWKGLVHK